MYLQHIDSVIKSTNENDSVAKSKIWSHKCCAIVWIVYLLLHWEEAILFPSYTTSWKGEPDAKIALPFVHLCAASAVHSALEVGFDSGMIRGRLSCPSFIAVKTSST